MRRSIEGQWPPVDEDRVLAAQALDFEVTVLEVVNNQGVLAGNFPQVAEIDVHVPDDFHAQLLALLLIIDR